MEEKVDEKSEPYETSDFGETLCYFNRYTSTHYDNHILTKDSPFHDSKRNDNISLNNNNSKNVINYNQILLNLINSN